MEKLVGRKRECTELTWAMESDRSEFVVLYGRRRVGKTFLIRSYFNNKYSFHFVGAHKQSRQQQLLNFKDALDEFSGIDNPVPDSWRAAFKQLTMLLDNCPDQRKVVFFDEMPWMETHGGGFVEELEYFWASWVQNRDDIVFIACGSATSWMKEKLEDNQGGLHNRITHRIYLRPFYLGECREYLLNHGFEWSEYQIMQCYMILGGVPYYWSLLQSRLSLPENIDNLIFRRGGSLCNEFNELYNALFNKADRYIEIVRFLANKRDGFSRNEIEQGTGLSGGGLTKILDNLERCDFIMSHSHFGNKSKMTLYRLSDFYSIFYFRYIENNKTKDEQYWQHHFSSRDVESWQGFSFEQLCLQHLLHIKVGLGIAGIATEASAWRCIANKTEQQVGAQIDLVIKRADGMTHLVEMKFAQGPYTITKQYEQHMLERKNLFADKTGSRNNVITFITPYGVKRNMHSGFVHSEISVEDLFTTVSRFE